MKKFLGLIVYAAVMFGVTAGLGMFMLKKSTPHATESEHGAESEDGEHEAAADGHGSKVASSDHGAPSEEGDDSSHGRDDRGSASHEPKRTASAEEQLPVAVRATPMSVEEIVRMGLSLKSRDETVRKREAALRELESQQKLAVADIQTAQQEIENLLAQAIEQRKATEQLQERLAEQEKTLAGERESIAAERRKLNDDLAQLDSDRKAVVQKEESVKRTTEENERRRKELDLAQQTLNTERDKYAKDLEKLNKQSASLSMDKQENATARATLEQQKKILEEQQKQLENEKRQLPKSSLTANTPEDAEALADTAKTLEGVQPERVAAILKTMAQSEGMDRVVEILRAMDKKKSALIIDAIEDEQFAADLATRFSSRNSATKSAEK